MEPFIWGQGGKKLSPADVARNRQVAAALAANGRTPQNVGQGFNRIGEALLYNSMTGRANRAEEEGRASAAAALAGLMGNEDPDMAAIMETANNPWMNDTQNAVVNALLQREMAPPPAPEYGFTFAPDGTMIRTDKTGGGIEEMGSYAEDPEQWTPLSPEEVTGMNLDPNLSWQRSPEGKVAQIGGSGVTVNVGDELSPGWKKIDENFAEVYLPWMTGGSADTQAQLSNLGNAIEIMENGDAGMGSAVSALPREIQAFFNTEGVIARENVEEVVQRSLRETLGAQFTEREGERLIQRAFNPLLPKEENLRRVRLLVNKINEMAQAKDAMVEYFDKNGTLRGYQGPAPRAEALDDVERQFGTDPEKGGDLPEGVTEEDVQFTMEKHSLTREQVLERIRNAR